MRNSSIISILFVVFFASCNNSQQTGTTPKVSVSIIPQQFFVNRIAGKSLEVNVMVLPGASPATYEPTPKQMINLAKSDVYFTIGYLGLEKAWENKLMSLNSQMKIVNTSEGLDLHKCTEKHEHSHNHSGVNPHIWLSPRMVKHQAQIIYQSLADFYPEKADEMKNNLDLFIQECDSVEQKMSKILSKSKGKSFIVYHPVWSYLADDFGLNEVSIEHNGKEATPNRLKQIIDLAKAKKIKVIFVQKEFSIMQAETIAKEINGEVVVLNPLEYNWFSVMSEFATAFDKVYN